MPEINYYTFNYLNPLDELSDDTLLLVGKAGELGKVPLGQLRAFYMINSENTDAPDLLAQYILSSQ